jgi:hypothetical protein
MNPVAAIFDIIDSIGLELPNTVPSVQDIKYDFVADKYDSANYKISLIRDFLSTYVNHKINVKSTIQMFEMLNNAIIDKSVEYAEKYAIQLFQLVSQNLINAGVMQPAQLKKFENKFTTDGFNEFMKLFKDVSTKEYKHNGATGLIISRIYDQLKYIHQVKDFYL